jgi:hypothetical protein
MPFESFGIFASGNDGVAVFKPSGVRPVEESIF